MLTKIKVFAGYTVKITKTTAPVLNPPLQSNKVYIFPIIQSDISSLCITLNSEFELIHCSILSVIVLNFFVQDVVGIDVSTF